jgi:hypothetical protein
MNCLLDTLLKGGYNGREEEEGNVSSYWMTLMKRGNTGT